MRLALVLALVVMFALLVPATAGAKARNPAVCVRLASQLVHYDEMKQRAAQLENDMWVGRFKLQIAHLEDRLQEHCPEIAAEQRAAQQLAELLKVAAKGALNFFTLGAF